MFGEVGIWEVEGLFVEVDRWRGGRWRDLLNLLLVGGWEVLLERIDDNELVCCCWDWCRYVWCCGGGGGYWCEGGLYGDDMDNDKFGVLGMGGGVIFFVMLFFDSGFGFGLIWVSMEDGFGSCGGL